MYLYGLRSPEILLTHKHLQMKQGIKINSNENDRQDLPLMTLSLWKRLGKANPKL